MLICVYLFNIMKVNETVKPQHDKKCRENDIYHTKCISFLPVIQTSWSEENQATDKDKDNQRSV